MWIKIPAYKDTYMTNQSKAQQVRDQIQDILERLGQSLEQWLNPQRLRPSRVPIPIPIDQPSRRKRNY